MLPPLPAIVGSASRAARHWTLNWRPESAGGHTRRHFLGSVPLICQALWFSYYHPAADGISVATDVPARRPLVRGLGPTNESRSLALTNPQRAPLLLAWRPVTVFEIVSQAQPARLRAWASAGIAKSTGPRQEPSPHHLSSAKHCYHRHCIMLHSRGREPSQRQERRGEGQFPIVSPGGQLTFKSWQAAAPSRRPL